MSTLSLQKLSELMGWSPEKRANYLFKEIQANQEIWILTDKHGCVLLNSDDEDCVPVWPHKACAEMWATGDWAECTAMSLSLKEWQQKWLSGLLQDDLAIAVFPDIAGEGIVVFSDEFKDEFNKINANK